MVKIKSPGGVVSWPENEGVLGVVGVAPWATLEFCQYFYSLIKAEKDWQYPRVLLDINTKLPSRGRHLQLHETDPSPYIAQTISELAEAGATVAIVVCNTAHILFERWGINSSIPIISIVDVVIKQAKFLKSNNILTLTSESLSKHQLYNFKAEKEGMLCHVLPLDFQTIVNGWIEGVKTKGKFSYEYKEDLMKMASYSLLNKIDTIIIGCTELSFIKEELKNTTLKIIDSNETLARAAYAHINKIKSNTMYY